MNFSLIIATKGRYSEIAFLLESIKDSMLDSFSYEVIIVDQNPCGFLQPLLKQYSDMPIVHILSDKSGLSYNRNIGLKRASGDVICFPDDDCLFYKNTFEEVLIILSELNIDFCVGRIFDREKNKNIIRNWPRREMRINKLNSYFVNSSITMFFKRSCVLEFDEQLGVGANYGSCEDADFLYRIVDNGAKGLYSPKIEVWHPEANFKDMPLKKVEEYASGFGYFIKKNTDFIKALLLLLLVLKKTFQLFFNVFNKKFRDGYFRFFFRGLFKGLNNNE